MSGTKAMEAKGGPTGDAMPRSVSDSEKDDGVALSEKMVALATSVFDQVQTMEREMAEIQKEKEAAVVRADKLQREIDRLKLQRVETKSSTQDLMDSWLFNDQPTYYPIAKNAIHQMVKKQQTTFWPPNDILILPQERDVFKSMPKATQHLLSNVLAFFASSDSMVASNLIERFQNDIKDPQVRAFYSLQNAMENIHAQTYGDLINALIEDPAERIKLLNGIREIPSVKLKGDWVQKWMHSDAPFQQRLIAFTIVEGLFFQGSFCVIFYLKQQKYEMPGLFQSNEFISRDEELHCEFAKLLYTLLGHKCEEKIVHSIVGEAVECERAFMAESLPDDLVGMNKRMMEQYIKYTADNLCVDLGVSRMFNVTNPFRWMENLALENKTNFFERRVSDYQHTGSEVLAIDADMEF